MTVLIPFVTFLGLVRIVIGIRREIRIQGREKSVKRGRGIREETRGRLGRNLRERNESFIHSIQTYPI